MFYNNNDYWMFTFIKHLHYDGKKTTSSRLNFIMSYLWNMQNIWLKTSLLATEKKYIQLFDQKLNTIYFSRPLLNVWICLTVAQHVHIYFPHDSDIKRAGNTEAPPVIFTFKKMLNAFIWQVNLILFFVTFLFLSHDIWLD